MLFDGLIGPRKGGNSSREWDSLKSQGATKEDQNVQSTKKGVILPLRDLKKKKGERRSSPIEKGREKFKKKKLKWGHHRWKKIDIAMGRKHCTRGDRSKRPRPARRTGGTWEGGGTTEIGKITGRTSNQGVGEK